VSKGEFRVLHNLTVAAGGVSVTADSIVIMPQAFFPWSNGVNNVSHGYMLVLASGPVALTPKTLRAVRVGQLTSSTLYWRGSELLERYQTTFALDQRTLDAILMQGSLTIGGDKAASITVTGLTFTRSPGFLSLISTASSASIIALAPHRCYYSVYLLYWYKSTNTDAARRTTVIARNSRQHAWCLSAAPCT
jgi:hypothetical protein